MIYWLAPGTLFANGDADCRVVGFLTFYSLLFACASENKQIGKLLTIIEDFSVSIGAIRPDTTNGTDCEKMSFELELTRQEKGGG
jgi:hypothetical protein